MSDSEQEIDDFAQNILERAKLRSRVLCSNSAKLAPIALEQQREVESVLARRQVRFEPRGSESSDEKMDSGEEADGTDTESGEENKLPPSEKPSRKQEAEVGKDGVPVGQRKPLKRLGELYSGAMLWSPAHEHTEGERPPDPTPAADDTKSTGRRTRLNALAKKINDWEDDLTHYVSPTSRFNISPPKQARKSAFSSPATNSVRNLGKGLTANAFNKVAMSKELHAKTDANAYTLSAHKNLVTKTAWDDSVLTALEAQGFVASENKTKLTYHCKDALTSPHDGVCAGRRSMSVSPTRKPVGSPLRNQGVSSVSSSSPARRTVDLPTRSRRSLSASPTRKPVGSPVRNVGGVASSSPERIPRQPMAEQTPRGKLSVAEKTALFESQLSFVATPPTKDPAELTVAQRAKLFEQQACGFVPKPFRPIASQQRSGAVANALKQVPMTASIFQPSKHEMSFAAFPRGKVENQRRRFERGEKMEVEEEKFHLPQPKVSSPPPSFIPPPPPLPMEQDLSLTFSALTDSPPEQSRPRSRSQSPKKATLMLPQSTTPKRAASPSPTRSRSSSPNKKKYPGTRDVKRIRVNDPKPGRIYPSLTDIESTETETEAEEPASVNTEDENTLGSGISDCSSLGTRIERFAKGEGVQEQVPIPTTPIVTPRRNHRYRPTEDFSATLACREIDAMIDDALEGQDFSIDTITEEGLQTAAASSTPIASTEVGPSSLRDEDESESTLRDLGTKRSIHLDERENGEEVGDGEASMSFVFSNSRLDLDNDSLKDASPLESSSPLYSRRRGQSPANGTPLLHTVSFFRKQQEQLHVTPRQVPQKHEEPEKVSPDHRAARVEALNETVRKLEDELAAQHRSIAQVSKALSLCKATVEFSDSTENVECERVLLIASQKRTGIMNEIYRLKTEGVLSSMATVSPSKNELGPSCLGKLGVSEIAVQLKRDFFTKAINGDVVYHFIALLKHRHQVEASSLISIGNGLSSSHIQNGVIHFPNTFTFGELEPSFEAKLEVYVLQTQKEFLPHEAKYHIKKQAKEKGLTPKKTKTESKFSRAFQQSPAGPDAVRTPNFTICGSLTIDISTLSRNHWNLDGVRFASPVEGSVALKIRCSAEGGEEKSGFLTLFTDVSGLGAWHRRWCKLTANQICIWMYPEDELEGKVAIEQIALRHCVTTRVCPVQREVCARANTLLVVTTRPPLPSDKTSLTTSCHRDYTAIRHLMSADTREERDAWCRQMNRALANLRAWDPQAHSPDDTLF